MGMDINEFCGTVGMATDALKEGIIKCEVGQGMDSSWISALDHAVKVRSV